MNRRDFLRLAAAGSAAAMLGRLGPARAAAGGAQKPNVLFIAIDDLNDWINCLGGHPGVKSPNLDRLAKMGMLFTNAHCAAPLCNPSRAALMTGIRPSTSGVYQNPQPWRESPVLKDAVTLPQHFMAHGYRAVGGGKIYHGAFPDPPSWQEYFPSQKQNKPPDPMPPGRPLNGIPNTAHFDWGPVDVPDEEMGDWKVASWAIGELNKKQEKFSGQSFFLACGFFRPHLPWYVPKKYFDLYPLGEVQLPKVKDDDLDDVPEIARKIARPEGDHRKVVEHKQWHKAVQAYMASISFTDACLGRVLDAFAKSAHAKNTLIVLWSDHGWHLGEKLHWRKFTLWEEATRNVLMFVVPGLTTPGVQCSRPVSLLDIYPTLVELCGLKPNKADGPFGALEGVSLVPLLRDPQAKWDRPAVTTYGRGNHSVRSEQWRYTRYKDGSEELYDHRADPMEWTNLAGDAKYNDVKAEHAKWLPKVNAPDIPGGKQAAGKTKAAKRKQ